jgi:thioredoxin reductase
MSGSSDDGGPATPRRHPLAHMARDISASGGRLDHAVRAVRIFEREVSRGKASDGVRTDRAGYVNTGPDLLDGGRRSEDWPLDRGPLALETSMPGLFAAGDVRSGSTKRVAAAVGEGAMAVALIHRRLEELAIAAG